MNVLKKMFKARRKCWSFKNISVCISIFDEYGLGFMFDYELFDVYFLFINFYIIR